MTHEVIEQIHNGKIPVGYKKTEYALLPEDWQIRPLSDISQSIKEVVGNRELETLSISAGVGFVNQAEKFGKELSGQQYEKYTVIKGDDFSYNKGNSKKYPQGCIYKLSNREIAAVPNVFYSFRLIGHDINYFEQLFISGFLNKQLYPLINSGVRNDGLLNLYEADFYKCRVIIPPLVEQQKIAEILTTCDKVIELKEKRIAEKQRQKLFLMQQLLTGRKRLSKFKSDWVTKKLGSLFSERAEANCDDLELLAITGVKGVVPRKELELKDNSSEDKSKYRKICVGDIGYNTMRMWQGVSAYSNHEGIVSPAYTILKPHPAINAKYFAYLFKMPEIIFLFYRYSQGLVDDTRNLKYNNFKKIRVMFPSETEEQTAIVQILETADQEIELLQKDLEQEKQKKKALMQLLLTGIVRVQHSA